jgi:hypothetical protein
MFYGEFFVQAMGIESDHNAPKTTKSSSSTSSKFRSHQFSHSLMGRKK